MTGGLVCLFVCLFLKATMKPERVGIASKLRSLTPKSVLRSVCISLGILELLKNALPVLSGKVGYLGGFFLYFFNFLFYVRWHL